VRLLSTGLRDLPFRRAFLACAERPSFVGQVHFKPSFTHPEQGSGRVPPQRHFLIRHCTVISELHCVSTMSRGFRDSGNAQADMRSLLALSFVSCAEEPCPHPSYLLVRAYRRPLLLLTCRVLYLLSVEQAGPVAERYEKIQRHPTAMSLNWAAWKGYDTADRVDRRLSRQVGYRADSLDGE
jgi:hypothetical protein